MHFKRKAAFHQKENRKSYVSFIATLKCDVYSCGFVFRQSVLSEIKTFPLNLSALPLLANTIVE